MTMPEPLKAPYSIEYAGGVSRTLGPRTSLRVDGVFRDYKNLYSQRTDLTTGRVTDGVGNAFDRTFVENTDGVRRRYAALLAQGSYSGDQFTLGGNYTLSRAYGNVEGETANGPSGASINHYPEYRRAEWNYPDGDLSIDQRHRARGWATYTVPMNPSAGSLAIGLVQQFGSGVPYGAIGLINPLSFMANPGYALPPAQIEYFFTPRDAFRTEATYRTDVSVNYSYRLRGTAEAFFHGEVLNRLQPVPAVRLRRHRLQQRRPDQPDDDWTVGGPGSTVQSLHDAAGSGGQLESSHELRHADQHVRLYNPSAFPLFSRRPFLA